MNFYCISMKTYIISKSICYGITADQDKESAIMDQICTPLLDNTNQAKVSKLERIKNKKNEVGFLKCYKNPGWSKFESDFENVKYVGVLDNYDKKIAEILNDEHKENITKFLHNKNTIPIFPNYSDYKYEPGNFTEHIKKLIYCREWDAIFDEKDSEKMYDDYLQYCHDYKKILINIVQSGDKLIIMDPDLWLLPSILEIDDVHFSVILQLPFLAYEFFRCLYRNNDILQSLLKCHIILQNEKEEKNLRRICDLTFINFNQKDLNTSVVPLVPQYVPNKNDASILDHIQIIKKKYTNKKIIVTVLNDSNVDSFQSLLIAYDDLNTQQDAVLLVLEYHEHKMTKEEKIEIVNSIGYITKKHGGDSIFHIAPTSKDQYYAILAAADFGVFIFEYSICCKYVMDFVTVNNSNFLVAESSSNIVEGIEINSNDQKALQHAICFTLENGENPKHAKNVQNLIHYHEIDFLSEVTKYKKKFILKEPEVLDEQKIIEKFRNSESKVLVLDYDGTMTEIVSVPKDARPSEEIHALFDKLLDIENLDVVICTGRKKEEIDEWFPDPRITIFAEHTAFKRINGEWIKRDFNLTWMSEAISIMQDFQEKTPGSHVEKKNSSAVFHYRKCDQSIGKIQAEACRKLLISTIGDIATVKQGKCIIEVTANGITKDYSCEQFLDREFKLCAGDDTTDEKMFEVEDFESICIGKKPTLAKYYLKTPAEFRKFLSMLE